MVHKIMAIANWPDNNRIIKTILKVKKTEDNKGKKFLKSL